MADASKFIDQARRRLKQARSRLLEAGGLGHGGMADGALKDLECAIAFMRQGEMQMASLGRAEETRQAWESAEQLRRQLVEIRALAQQANAFYAARILVLEGQESSAGYGADGVLCDPDGERVLAAGSFEKGVVIHG